MKLDNLETLFLDELADLRSAEEQLIKALPDMAEAAHSPRLRDAFNMHLVETQAQAERLDRIIQRVGDGAPKKTCKAMEGLIKEGKERVKATGDPAVIDAGIIAAAQRVEHYEIAGYGCVRTYAELLGYDEAAALLEQSLQEEKAADVKLNELAVSMINEEAASAS